MVFRSWESNYMKIFISAHIAESMTTCVSVRQLSVYYDAQLGQVSANCLVNIWKEKRSVKKKKKQGWFTYGRCFRKLINKKCFTFLKCT